MSIRFDLIGRWTCCVTSGSSLPLPRPVTSATRRQEDLEMTPSRRCRRASSGSNARSAYACSTGTPAASPSPEPGRRLLPSARELVAAADAFVIAAHELGEPPPIRLGLCATDLGPLIGHCTPAVRAAGPPIHPTVAGGTRLIDLYRQGRLDIALVRHPGVADGLTAGEVIRLVTHVAQAADRLPFIVPPATINPPPTTSSSTSSVEPATEPSCSTPIPAWPRHWWPAARVSSRNRDHQPEPQRSARRCGCAP